MFCFFFLRFWFRPVLLLLFVLPLAPCPSAPDASRARARPSPPLLHFVVTGFDIFFTVQERNSQNQTKTSQKHNEKIERKKKGKKKEVEEKKKESKSERLAQHFLFFFPATHSSLLSLSFFIASPFSSIVSDVDVITLDDTLFLKQER